MTLRSPNMVSQRRGNRIVVPPATEPATADELRTQLVIDSTILGDTEAGDLIEAARQTIEDMTGLALITQEWLMAIDRWPSGPEPWWDGVRQGAIGDLHAPGAYRQLEIPRYPLISVDGVNVYAEDGTAAAVSVASVFDVDTYRVPGRMTLRSGATWPIAMRSSNAIEISYTAGYGAAGDVPAPLKRAVIDMAAYLFEHKGGCSVDDAYGASGAMMVAGRYEAARI